MADFLDKKRDEIVARLSELQPLVAEYERLKAAVAALDGVPVPAPPARPARPARRPGGRPATPSSGNNATGARRGRPKGSGKRGEQALAFITDNPGITIPELAEKMKINQNYLYRVLPGLAENHKVRKEGRGWHPVTAA